MQRVEDRRRTVGLEVLLAGSDELDGNELEAVDDLLVFFVKI